MISYIACDIHYTTCVSTRLTEHDIGYLLDADVAFAIARLCNLAVSLDDSERAARGPMLHIHLDGYSSAHVCIYTTKQ